MKKTVVRLVGGEGDCEECTTGQKTGENDGWDGSKVNYKLFEG